MSISLFVRGRGSLSAYLNRAGGNYASATDKNRHTAAGLFLTAMLDYSPTSNSREGVAHAVTLCGNDDEKLYELYRYYLLGLFVPMKAQGGRTPTVSSHPSRRSAEITRESIDSDQATLKDLCLKRDAGRCVISGIMDKKFARKHPEVQHPGTEYGNLEAAHIIPFLPVGINNLKGKEKDNSSQVATHKLAGISAATWDIITMFTGIQSSEEFNDENIININQLENVITLFSDLHRSFGELDIWLEPLEGQLNTYKFGKADDISSSIPAGTVITLTDHQTQLPLPNPRYLALHAACAKIAHASGAADTIDSYLRDLETTKVLSQDGSSMASLEAVSQALHVI